MLSLVLGSWAHSSWMTQPQLEDSNVVHICTVPTFERLYAFFQGWIWFLNLFNLDTALDKTFLFHKGKEHLEKSALLCIKLVEMTLAKQEGFLIALRASGTATMVSQMDKLLLAINPRSNKPSHLANITKYVVHQSIHSSHVFPARVKRC